MRDYVRHNADIKYDHNGKEIFDLTTVNIIAEKSGVPQMTLWTWFENPLRAGPMPFDVADRLLCACFMWNLWYCEFAEWYQAVDLRWRQCEHPDCANYFLPTTGPGTARGGNAQRYCTTKCASSHGHGNRRIKHWKLGKDGHTKKCRNGHERTPENTINLQSGKIRCRVCNNATSAANYHRRRAAA